MSPGLIAACLRAAAVGMLSSDLINQYCSMISLRHRKDPSEVLEEVVQIDGLLV